MSRKKKSSKRLGKLIKSESDEETSEHELSYYINDRVKLMKEVLKIINAKKIKSMAPHCVKNMKNEEINSMLLEELLGISNKRLRCIFNGQNLEEDSTDPEEEPIDIISLDDISEDDFIDLDSDVEKKTKRKHRVKTEGGRKKIKKEKHKSKEKGKTDQENLMSVLELLELQARARAIKSQLVLEAAKKNETAANENIKIESDDDEVIIEVPKPDEIVIPSSDDEDNGDAKKHQSKEATKENEENNDKGPEIEESQTVDVDKPSSSTEETIDIQILEPEKSTDEETKTTEELTTKDAEDNEKLDNTSEETDNEKPSRKDNEETAKVSQDKNINEEIPKKGTAQPNYDENELVLNVDEDEMDCIICD